MKRIYIYILLITIMTISMSCSKKDAINGGDRMYLELNASSGDSKITYDGASLKWNSSDELSCYAGTASNMRFVNKYNSESVGAVFACNDAPDWGTADFYSVYPYKAGGYTISDGKLYVTVPTMITVGENDYSSTILFGKANSITPTQLYNTPIPMKQVYSIVRVKIPAVSDQKAISVIISNSNAHLDSGFTLYNSGNVDADGNWEYGTPVGYIEYSITGAGYGTEVFVNIPIIPTTTNASYNITVKYMNNAEKLRTIYNKPITKNSSSYFTFNRNQIMKIGFKNGSTDNLQYKYTVWDWIETHPTDNSGRNYIDTGIGFDRNYFIGITISTTNCVHNRWFIGRQWGYERGFEFGEYINNGKGYYLTLNNKSITMVEYKPYMYPLYSNSTYRYGSGETGNIILFNRGMGNTEFDSWYSFKCFSLYIRKDNATGPYLLSYVPVKNSNGAASMFDLIRGCYCTVCTIGGDSNVLTADNSAK